MSTLKVNNLTDLGADAVVTDGVVDSGALPAGSILQVLDTTATSQVSTTSQSYQASGLSVSITPSASNSKIHLQYFVMPDTTSDGCHTTIFRDSTNLADRSYTSVATVLDLPGRNIQTIGSYFLDSPSTTSEITYTVQFRSDGGLTTMLRNELSRGRLILMEVAG